jgi:hypothetical protein
MRLLRLPAQYPYIPNPYLLNPALLLVKASIVSLTIANLPSTAPPSPKRLPRLPVQFPYIPTLYLLIPALHYIEHILVPILTSKILASKILTSRMASSKILTSKMAWAPIFLFDMLLLNPTLHNPKATIVPLIIASPSHPAVLPLFILFTFQGLIVYFPSPSPLGTLLRFLVLLLQLRPAAPPRSTFSTSSSACALSYSARSHEAPLATSPPCPPLTITTAPSSRTTQMRARPEQVAL